MRVLVPTAFSLLALAACGERGSAPATAPAPAGMTAAHDHDHDHDHDHAGEAGHGKTEALGRVTLAGHEWSVTRLGTVVPGREGAFEAKLEKGPAGATAASASLFLWIEGKDGSPVCAPSKGTLEGGALHFHVTPRPDAKDLDRVVLRLRSGAVDERAALPLGGHDHHDGPNGGIVAAIRGPDGAVAGHVELKLHDDQGDLELWLAKDAKFTQPLDVPLDSAIRVEFVDAGGRTVDLRVRNRERNEDEGGKASVRDGRTNYFIFPGDSGTDASWLKGAGFSSGVRMTFSADGKAYVSEEFRLVPHSHADGHGH